MTRDLAEEGGARQLFPGALFGFLRALQPLAPLFEGRRIMLHAHAGSFQLGQRGARGPVAVVAARFPHPVQQQKLAFAIVLGQARHQSTQGGRVLGAALQRQLIQGAHIGTGVQMALEAGQLHQLGRTVLSDGSLQRLGACAHTFQPRVVLLPLRSVVAAPLFVEVFDPPFGLIAQQGQGIATRPVGQCGRGIQRFDAVPQAGVGVVHTAQALERLAQCVVGKSSIRGLGQETTHAAIRPHRQRIASGTAPVVAPELCLQRCAPDLDLGQGGGGHITAQQLARNAVGLVFVLAGQRKRLGRKARKVPAHERLRGRGHRAFVVGQTVVQAHPRQACAIDPGRKPAMVAAQVAVLVCQHGEKTRPVQRHQQRQPDAQVVNGATQQAVLGQLLDARIELVVQRDLVDGRALDLAADALQRLKKLRCLQRRDLHALRRVKTHPQRPQADPQQARSPQQQPHHGKAKLPLQHLRHHPQQNACGKSQAPQHPGIAQRRKHGHTAAVCAAVVSTGMLAHAHQMHKICLIHGLPSLLGCFQPPS